MAVSVFKGDPDVKIIRPLQIDDETSDEENAGFILLARGDVYPLRPVVILLGWNGATMEDLKPFSLIYERQKYITVSCVPPLRLNGMEEVAEWLKGEVLTESRLVSHPIVLHVFSTLGCQAYTAIAEVGSRDRALDIRGVILDSCPGQQPVRNQVWAMDQGLQNVWFPIRYLFTRWNFFYIMAVHTYLLLRGDMHPQITNAFYTWRYIFNDRKNWPQLYLYSKADAVISSEGIDGLVLSRREMGYCVLSKCWEDSPHVGHLSCHEKEYTKLCLDFLTRCLDRTAIVHGLEIVPTLMGNPRPSTSG